MRQTNVADQRVDSCHVGAPLVALAENLDGQLITYAGQRHDVQFIDGQQV